MKRKRVKLSKNFKMQRQNLSVKNKWKERRKLNVKTMERGR